MTQLLTSVKNVEEAMLALYAGVNLIDLKDPYEGALGALDVEVVTQIIDKLSEYRQPTVLLSATVGEKHETVSELVSDVVTYRALGVDIIKVAISDLLKLNDGLDKMEKIINDGVKMVAVFFAEDAIDLTVLKKLAAIGFYGAMIDTRIKEHSMVDVMASDELSRFVSICTKNALKSGLAGSVNETHIAMLTEHRPDFVGMRGGLCEEQQRTAGLSGSRLQSAMQLLLACNSNTEKLENLSNAVCN